MTEAHLTSNLMLWCRCVWKRFWCRHDWDPVYHSYHCEKCGAWNYD